MRVLLAGDTHGNLSWWRTTLIPFALFAGCDRIIQLGDFGYWPHTKAGAKYLHRLNDELEAKDIDVYFLDDNHENHDWLRSIYVSQDATRTELKHITSRIHYMPRGHSFRLDGIKFLVCGGAYSIDMGSRIEGVSWWPGELITDLDVRTCKAQGHADVLLSHDAPGVHYIGEHAYAKLHPATTANRDKLTEIMHNARPRLVVHGHWHTHYEKQVIMDYSAAMVLGLACDGMPLSCCVLDAETMQVTYPTLAPVNVDRAEHVSSKVNQ